MNNCHWALLSSKTYMLNPFAVEVFKKEMIFISYSSDVQNKYACQVHWSLQVTLYQFSKCLIRIHDPLLRQVVWEVPWCTGPVCTVPGSELGGTTSERGAPWARLEGDGDHREVYHEDRPACQTDLHAGDPRGETRRVWHKDRVFWCKFIYERN